MKPQQRPYQNWQQTELHAGEIAIECQQCGFVAVVPDGDVLIHACWGCGENWYNCRPRLRVAPEGKKAPG